MSNFIFGYPETAGNRVVFVKSLYLVLPPLRHFLPPLPFHLGVCRVGGDPVAPDELHEGGPGIADKLDPLYVSQVSVIPHRNYGRLLTGVACTMLVMQL